MLTRILNHRSIDAVLLALAAAVALAWVTDFALAGVSFGVVWSGWVTRLGLLLVALALVLVSIVIASTRAIALERVARTYYSRIFKESRRDLVEKQLQQPPPALEQHRFFKDLNELMRQYVHRFEKQLGDLEQTRARAEVRAHQAVSELARLRDVVSRLSEPVVAINDYDEVVLANFAATRLFQLGEESTEQHAIAELIKCEALVALLTDTRSRRLPSQRTSEVEVKDTAGGSHWYAAEVRSLVCTGATDGDAFDHESHGAVAVLREISDQKATQRQHAEFVSAVSHEMKTPLAGIKAYVELLVDGDAEDDETREEFLSVINSQTDRLQRLIDNLLNLARIEAGVVDVNKERRSLNDILEESLGVVAPAAERKSIQLASDLSPLHLSAQIDRDMILQAAINLLSNAIKYTLDGGKVTLRSRLEGDSLRFEVEDTGVGLSEEDCEKVFDKFYRVKGNQNMAPGTGLGLPLARHIVEDVHGGKIEVVSQLGQGSVFRVMLPAVK